MKKAFIVLLISVLSYTVTAQDPVHPALCHKFTNEPYPAFFSAQLPFDGFTPGDWLGVYSLETMKCCGAESAGLINYHGQFPGYADNPTTEYKDGFDAGEVMYLFMYSLTDKKFYNLSASLTDYSVNQTISEMIYGPLNLFTIKDIVKCNEIQLQVDPVVSEVIFNFMAFELPIITGGSDAIKFKLIHQNTTNPTFFVAIGKGSIERRWDGYYYKYTADDRNVIINAVGQNNFTGEMVTSNLTLVLDQSISSNVIFQDENIVFYLKENTIYAKCKTLQISFALYRWDGGIEKKSYGWKSLREGAEVQLFRNYTRSWKGTELRMEYKIRQGGSFSGIIQKTFTL